MHTEGPCAACTLHEVSMKFRPIHFLSILLLIAVFLLYKNNQHRGRGRTSSPPSRRERQNRQQRFPQDQRPLPHEGSASCKALGVTCASQYLATWAWPKDGSCVLRTRNGYPVPDPRCTPGGVVPGLSATTLRDPQWRTRCIRNCQSTEQQKHVAYAWYGLAAPVGNDGRDQVCELDHLVPLELGGADGLGNIWPQCGPDATTLKNRYFKRKDLVENYLASSVKAGTMSLEEAQRGIAADWTQYLPVAVNFRDSGSR